MVWSGDNNRYLVYNTIYNHYTLKIIIDADEVKSIGNRLINLANQAKGANSERITEGNKPNAYKGYPLSEKEMSVFDFIKDNPGTNKENVVKNIPTKSRIPLLGAINELGEKGFIIIEKNKQEYHLSVNRDNDLASLSEDLSYFKIAYFSLIDQVKETLKKKCAGKDIKFYDYWDLVDTLIMPYKYLIIMHIVSDLFLWRVRPLDDETLHRKFTIVFDNVLQIYNKLGKIIPNSKFEPNREMLSNILYETGYGFSPETIYTMLKTFEKYGLSEGAEPVIDALWKLNYPILPLLSPFYKIDEEEGRLQDWRKQIAEYRNFKYTPKTTQKLYE
jgi:hypothetical protein